MPGDEAGHLVEPVERARQAQEHEPGAGEQLGAERHRAHLARESGAVGVRGECAFARDEVLVHPDAASPRRGGTERERAVGVVDDDQLARAQPVGEGAGLVEDQPVRGIRRLEPVTLDVGVAAERTEVEGHAPRLRAESGADGPPDCV